jgi:hypothetical protein
VEELSAEVGPRTNNATGFFVDRIMRLAMRIGTGRLQAGLADRDDSPVLAIYSSALANVYFTDVSRRMEEQDIETRAPGLLNSLVAHPGIGLVLVQSSSKTRSATGSRAAFEVSPDALRRRPSRVRGL